MEDGKKLRRAERRSAADSSANPAVAGVSSSSSSSSASALCSGGASVGTRNPVRYQFDGRTQPGMRSPASSWLAGGPMRSRLRALARWARASAEVAGEGVGLMDAPVIAAVNRVEQTRSLGLEGREGKISSPRRWPATQEPDQDIGINQQADGPLVPLERRHRRPRFRAGFATCRRRASSLRRPQVVADPHTRASPGACLDK